MASPNASRDLKALKRLITQADLILSSIPNPHPSSPAARENLNAAIRLADQLSDVNPAAVLGQKGGAAVAKQHGSDYFRELASKRKNRAGGRPRKSDL